MTKNNKKSKIPTKVEDLEDIDLYFKDSHNIEGFWVAQNYIATFQDGEQIIYDDFFSVDKGISAEDFDKKYKEWIITYSDVSFENLANSLENLIETNKESYDIDQAQYLYKRAMQLELDFFNAYSDF